jgi:hypothetical protein
MSTTEAQPPKLPALMVGGEVRPIVPQSFEDAWRIAVVVTKSGLAPFGLDTPEKAMVAIMHGMEVGLLPMAALQSIAVINGKPSIYGDGLLALVRRSGLLEEITETFAGADDDLTAICAVRRKGDPEPTVGSFSVAQAKLSGLWVRLTKHGEKTPWQLYPKRMLQMRARAYALRDGFPDVLKGLAVREEMDDVESMRDVTPASPEPPVPPPGPVSPPPVAETPPPVAPADVTQTWEDDAPEDPPAATGRVASASEEPPAASEGVASASGTVEDEPFDPETGELPPDDDDDIPPIPPILDRRKPPEPTPEPAGDEVDWLTELDNAFSGAEGSTDLVEEQRARMAPRKGKVSPASWKKAEQMLQSHVLRLRP